MKWPPLKKNQGESPCPGLFHRWNFLIAGCLGMLLLTVVGCSGQNVSARIYLYRAGQLYFKTDNTFRRVQRMPFEERKKFYREACQLYYKAFQLDSRVFDLDEIGHALQCCESADVHEINQAFQDFYDVYEAEHPVESDYGMMSGGAVE